MKKIYKLSNSYFQVELSCRVVFHTFFLLIKFFIKSDLLGKLRILFVIRKIVNQKISTINEADKKYNIYFLCRFFVFWKIDYLVN